MINIGLIGYGYWGPNLLRNFNNLNESQIISVCDLQEENRLKVKRQYPSIEVLNNYHDLIHNPKINAVAIATPVSTHFQIAYEALNAGKHVLIEKPMTATSEEANQLIEESCSKKLTLMVDHTFIFTGAVQKIKELVTSNQLGEIFYYDSVRINLGLFQHDVNVIWDLAVHDLAIMDYLLDREPRAVSATGVSHVANQPEDVAYLTVFFDNNIIAHIHVNWLSPVKIRKTLLGGSQRMIVYDDLEPSEKVKVYDKGITVQNTNDIYKMLVGYRSGDMWAPQLERTEALHSVALNFIESIQKGLTPLTNAESGMRNIRLLEAANISLRENGKPISIYKFGYG